MMHTFSFPARLALLLALPLASFAQELDLGALMQDFSTRFPGIQVTGDYTPDQFQTIDRGLSVFSADQLQNLSTVRVHPGGSQGLQGLYTWGGDGGGAMDLYSGPGFDERTVTFLGAHAWGTTEEGQQAKGEFLGSLDGGWNNSAYSPDAFGMTSRDNLFASNVAATTQYGEDFRQPRSGWDLPEASVGVLDQYLPIDQDYMDYRDSRSSAGETGFVPVSGYSEPYQVSPGLFGQGESGLLESGMPGGDEGYAP